MSSWVTPVDWIVAGIGGATFLAGIVFIAVRPAWVPVRGNEYGWRPGPAEVGFCFIIGSTGATLGTLPKLLGAPSPWRELCWAFGLAFLVAAIVKVVRWRSRKGERGDQ